MIVDGKLAPRGPGLGLEWDERAVQRLRAGDLRSGASRRPGRARRRTLPVGANSGFRRRSPALRTPDATHRASVKSLEDLGRVRLSENFFMRDFLYSEVANLYGIPNIPDDPDLAIETGRALCENLLEPLREKFGRISIRSAYRCREVARVCNERGHNCAKPEIGARQPHLGPARRRGLLRRDGDDHRARLHPLLSGDRPLGGDGVVGARPPALFAMQFFPKFAAFNLGWREVPKRRITSYDPAAARPADQGRHGEPVRLARERIRRVHKLHHARLTRKRCAILKAGNRACECHERVIDISRGSAFCPARSEGDGGMDALASAWDRLQAIVARAPLASAVALTVLASLVFASFPGIDLATSALFYEPGEKFPLSRMAILRDLRAIGSDLPVIIAIIVAVALALKLTYPSRSSLLPPRVALYYLSLFMIGPLLIVNGVLKALVGPAAAGSGGGFRRDVRPSPKRGRWAANARGTAPSSPERQPRRPASSRSPSSSRAPGAATSRS